MFLSCTSQILLTFPILPSIMNQIRLKFTRCLTFESQERYNYQIYNSHLHLMRDMFKIYSNPQNVWFQNKINSNKSGKTEKDHQESCLKYDINVAKMLKSIIANKDKLFNEFLQHKKSCDIICGNCCIIFSTYFRFIFKCVLLHIIKKGVSSCIK